MIEPVVYQCSAKPHEHRLLLCVPIKRRDGTPATLFCACDAPMTFGPVDGFLAQRLCSQARIEGQHSVLVCLSDEEHATTKSFFKVAAGERIEVGDPVVVNPDGTVKPLPRKYP